MCTSTVSSVFNDKSHASTALKTVRRTTSNALSITVLCAALQLALAAASTRVFCCSSRDACLWCCSEGMLSAFFSAVRRLVPALLLLRIPRAILFPRPLTGCCRGRGQSQVVHRLCVRLLLRWLGWFVPPASPSASQSKRRGRWSSGSGRAELPHRTKNPISRKEGGR